MIRSMSYSRYFRIATPMDTGSAPMPTTTTLSTAWKAGDAEAARVPATATNAVAAMHTAAPLISHFSCCRRSPSARRQDSTWRATNNSQNTGRPARVIHGPQGTAGNDLNIARGDRADRHRVDAHRPARGDRQVAPQHRPPPARGQPTVREEQDHQREHGDQRDPPQRKEHRRHAQRKVMTEPVAKHRVGPGRRAED